MSHRWLIGMVVAFASCAAFAAAPARDEDGGARLSTPTPTSIPSSPTLSHASDLGGRVLETVEFAHVPLRDAIERLRAQAGINVFVSWNVLTHAGVAADTPVDAKLTNVTFGKVLDLILSDAAGGDGKLAWAADDGVIRISTAADIERAAMLRRERKEWADELRAQTRLDERLPSLHLDRMPLWQAIETVATQAGVKVDVPWQTLEEVGVGRSAPITVSLDRPTTAAALTAILADASDRGVPLGFTLRGDGIEVATRATLRRITDVRAYDVSDLISAELPAPPANADTHKDEKQRSPAGSEFHGVDDVAQWIKETVEPESWRDSRGGIASLRVLHGRYAGLLVITQTDDNHRQIARVLNSLRELRPADEKVLIVPPPISSPAPADAHAK